MSAWLYVSSFKWNNSFTSRCLNLMKKRLEKLVLLFWKIFSWIISNRNKRKINLFFGILSLERLDWHSRTFLCFLPLIGDTWIFWIFSKHIISFFCLNCNWDQQVLQQNTAIDIVNKNLLPFLHHMFVLREPTTFL